MSETPMQDEDAPWSPPKHFRIIDLFEAAPTGRAFLSQVLDFMAFGTPDNMASDIKSYEELQARLRPAKLLVLKAAAAGEVILEGVREGEEGQMWPQRIPRQIFEHPRTIDVNEIYLDTAKLSPAKMMVGAERVKASAWINIEVEMPSLCEWLAKLGAERGPDSLYFDDGADLVGRFGRRQLRLDNLRRGLIGIKAADQATNEEDGRPLVYAPPHQSYNIDNPMNVDRWSLPMAVAWIAYRHINKVIEQTDAWCREARFAQKVRSNDMTLYGPDQIKSASFSDGGGFQIVRLRQGYLRRLIARHVGAHSDANRTGSFSDGEVCRSARDKLWQALSEGSIEATGASAITGARVLIPEAEWQDLEADYDQEADAEYLSSRVFVKPRDRYFLVTVRRNDVLRLWRADVEDGEGPASAFNVIEIKRPNHRPEEFLWNEFDPVVRERFEDIGDFDKRTDRTWYMAAAIKEMTAWCEAQVENGKWIKVPSPSAIRDRINKVRDEFLLDKMSTDSKSETQ